MLLSWRGFSGGVPSGVICWERHFGLWPGLAFAFLPPLQDVLGYFEASGTLRLNDIQPAFMSMWKEMPLWCCRAILISLSVSLRATAQERLLDIVLWQHICFAEGCFEGQPFALTAFPSSLPAFSSQPGWFLLIVIFEVVFEMEIRGRADYW